MAISSRNEMINGFIEEVKGYIEPLTQNIEALRQQPDRGELIEETHRLVHTIKGASSMVGLTGLSQIAQLMETVFDDIIAGQLECNHDIIQAMAHTVDQFDKYCIGFFNGGAAAREMLAETFLIYRDLRNGGSDKVEKSLEVLLETVPEYERGNAGTPEPENDREMAAECLGEDLEPPTDQTLADLDLETVPELEEIELNDDIDQQSTVQTQEPAILPELLESFYQEAEDHLTELSQSLNVLESQVDKPVTISSAQREEIRRIRRSVHTLKGAAAVIGLKDFSGYAHNLEDLLDWLFETASEITPEILAVVVEASDLLEPIIAAPNEAKSPKAIALNDKYRDIMGSAAADNNLIDASIELENLKEAEILQQVSTPAENETSQDAAEKSVAADRPSIYGRTLRISMERIDDLVNLTGELMIASSAFDQRIEIMREAVIDMEFTRNRLREIARELEVSYEVKALERLGSTLNFAHTSGTESLPSVGFEDFDALELDRYSELNLIIRTLNESVVDVGAIHNQVAGLQSDFDGHLTRQRVIMSELQDKIMRVRMTPMSVITDRLRRTVREVAGVLNKKVRLDIKGSDIELDRIIWDKITDPLMHLLRNAVDHGIESPEQRVKHSKPRVGNIELSAARQGNQVVIQIVDDGAGLNYQAIRETIRSLGLSGRVDELLEEQLADFIFHPGFSTSNQISQVSGRGVGMDVVRENIQDLKGTIRIASEKNKGTQFTIRIPLTLAAVQALLFTAGSQTLAMPLNEIKEIVRIDPENMLEQPENVVQIEDQVLPLFNLPRQLGAEKGSAGSAARSANPILLIVESGERHGALTVDTLVGQREIVIKSLGSHLRHVRGISGVTILGDGSVVPILNIEEFFWSDAVTAEPVFSSTPFVGSEPLKVMVVDDSISLRRVVSRLLIDQGWIAETAKDGVDALEKLRDFVPELIILDIEMPRMNGYEFLGALRSQNDYKNLPVVMLSSRTARKHRDKAIDLGADDFMIKPYNDEELVRLIMKLTRKG